MGKVVKGIMVKKSYIKMTNFSISRNLRERGLERFLTCSARFSPGACAETLIVALNHNSKKLKIIFFCKPRRFKIVAATIIFDTISGNNLYN